jgi:ANTAR domain-containing protein
LWLGGSPGADRLRYSAYARLQARLASMPVIEQAKGIIMAHCGWPEDQAFDALRRASQRETSNWGTWPPGSWPQRRVRK